MTSSVASGEKARNVTSDRAQRNNGGGEPLVLNCTYNDLLNKEN